jgi:hypothetical protein
MLTVELQLAIVQFRDSAFERCVEHCCGRGSQDEPTEEEAKGIE